ncbi:MAG: FixH family protein [Burkholderiales bacterium]|nr:FixH family protein [Burkholderiales bacterium]
MEMTREPVPPWYREPWPWLLMAGPVTVIVAGIATIWIAVASSDGLVVDDYYRQGLAINQTLKRGALAAQRGYRAEAVLQLAGNGISVRLVTTAAAELPQTLQLHITHPTRAGRDGLVLLRQRSPGLYEGVVPVLSAGRWVLLLEDLQSSWRLSGTMTLPAQTAFTLLPEQPQ